MKREKRPGIDSTSAERRTVITALLNPRAAALETLVERGRAAFAASLKSPPYPWEASCWTTNHLAVANHAAKSALYWTLAGSQTELLPTWFADTVKSWIVLERKAPATMVNQHQGARWLWAGITHRQPDTEGFMWSMLTPGDCREAERRMIAKGMSPRSIYLYCQNIKALVKYLGHLGLCPIMDAAFVTPAPRPGDTLGKDGKTDREEKMPSDAAIEAVADIYHTHAKTDFDRLMSAGAAIQFATGFRAGELLTLPHDPLVEDPSRTDGKIVGIRYFKEKSKDRARVRDTFWCTPAQALIVRDAIQRIQDLTRAPRERAKLIEERDGVVTVPGYDEGDEITTRQVAEICGCDESTCRKWKEWPKPCRVEYYGRGKGQARWYRVADVMECLTRRQAEASLWTVKDADGEEQCLSESLFVVYENFGDDWKGMNPLLVTSLPYTTFDRWLGGKSFVDKRRGAETVQVYPSVFERFGLTERDGSRIEINSHAFRHWIVTKAKASGIDDRTLMRWQNRESITQLQSYNHLTHDEKRGFLKQAIKDRKVAGRVVTMYFAIEESDRDVFLDNLIQAVHVTDLGICVHNFATSPCPRHLRCLGCSDFLYDPANPRARQQLVQLEYRSSRALEDARKQAAQGMDDFAQEWVAQTEEAVEYSRALLALSTDAAPSRPFEDRPSRFASV